MQLPSSANWARQQQQQQQQQQAAQQGSRTLAEIQQEEEVRQMQQEREVCTKKKIWASVIVGILSTQYVFGFCYASPRYKCLMPLLCKKGNLALLLWLAAYVANVLFEVYVLLVRFLFGVLLAACFISLCYVSIRMLFCCFFFFCWMRLDSWYV
jgi:hypothetical protein